MKWYWKYNVYVHEQVYKLSCRLSFVKDGKILKQMYVDMKYILCLSTKDDNNKKKWSFLKVTAFVF